jgi:hypothetical protein
MEFRKKAVFGILCLEGVKGYGFPDNACPFFQEAPAPFGDVNYHPVVYTLGKGEAIRQGLDPIR